MINMMLNPTWRLITRNIWHVMPTSETHSLILDLQIHKYLPFFSQFYRVLLRVRMLYYIKHEVIGDYVQQIQDGIPIRYFFHIPNCSSFSIKINFYIPIKLITNKKNFFYSLHHQKSFFIKKKKKDKYIFKKSIFRFYPPPFFTHFLIKSLYFSNQSTN